MNEGTAEKGPESTVYQGKRYCTNQKSGNPWHFSIQRQLEQKKEQWNQGRDYSSPGW